MSVGCKCSYTHNYCCCCSSPTHAPVRRRRHVARGCSTSGVPRPPPPPSVHHFPADSRRMGRLALMRGAIGPRLATRARVVRIRRQLSLLMVAAAAAAADDLLVITRSHKTQLYLPTQSISQGTTTHAKPTAAAAAFAAGRPLAPPTGHTARRPFPHHHHHKTHKTIINTLPRW